MRTPTQEFQPDLKVQVTEQSLLELVFYCKLHNRRFKIQNSRFKISTSDNHQQPLPLTNSAYLVSLSLTFAPMRLILIFIGLAAVVLITFFIWGDPLMETFSMEGSVHWLKHYGMFAWFAAIVLLMVDLVLPLPATLIMSALGFLYGPLTGGLVSAVGSFASGSFGYWLCRLSGEKMTLRLLGEKDYNRGKKIFSRKIGGFIIALSRWLPVFPEVMACMAGFVRMSPLRFHVALLCGSLPLGFTFAYIGYTGVDSPLLSIALCAGVPALLWALILPFFTERLDD